MPPCTIPKEFILLNASYIGKKELAYITQMVALMDAEYLMQNFASMIKYAIYACTDEYSKPFLNIYGSYEMVPEVVEDLRRKLLGPKSKI